MKSITLGDTLARTLKLKKSIMQLSSHELCAKKQSSIIKTNEEEK